MRKFDVHKILKLIWEKGAIHIFTGSFLVKFVTFFGSVIIVRLLSKAEYGLLSYSENLYSFAYILAGFGLTNAVVRYVVLAKTEEEKKAVFDFIHKLSFKINLALIVIFAVINTFYDHTENFETCRIYIYIMLLSIPFQYCIDNDLSLERSLFNNKKYAFFSFIFAASTVLARLLGAIFNGVLGVIIFVVVLNITLALLFSKSKDRRQFEDISRITLEGGMKKNILKYGFQYMLTNGLWTLFMLIDIFMFGKILNNPAMIAEYKVAYAWPANISIICTAIGIFIAPYFIKNENNPVWIRKNYIRTFLLSFIFVGAAGLVMILLAKPLIYIYGGADYYNIIPLMQILTIGSIINNGLRYTTANIFAAMGRIKFNMAVSMLGIVVQILLNLYMIPRLGMYGPAVTGIVNYSIMAIILFVCFAKINNLFIKINR